MLNVQNTNWDAQTFATWLQGFIEISGGKVAPTTAQWAIIVEHLQLVFQKITTTVSVSSTDFREAIKAAEESAKKVGQLPDAISSKPIDYDEIFRRVSQHPPYTLIC